MPNFAKLIARLRTIPPDFRWGELVRVLKGLGFTEISDKGGSYRTFVDDSGRKIFLHKPHPQAIVKKYVLREVVQSLQDFDLI